MMHQTLMEQEANESPDVIARQLKNNAALWQEIAQRLHKHPVHFIVTIARGSSDHAANFAKYALETELGLVCASAAPSVTTLYHSKLKLKNSLVIGLSQSGQSPDICEVMSMAKENGAMTIAIVNQVDSPLANMADFVIPLCAGTEQAVAATKSYIASIAAIVQMISICNNNAPLADGLKQLPEILSQAIKTDWSETESLFSQTEDCLVIGRGYGYPIAQEAALKFKETCSIHAEAFSGAELLHGPVALVKPNFPVLLFTQNDATYPGTENLAHRLVEMSGKVIIVRNADCPKIDNGYNLILPNSLHPLLDPIIGIQAFYPMIARLSQLKGLCPDQPKNLQKVTKTR